MKILITLALFASLAPLRADQICYKTTDGKEACQPVSDSLKASLEAFVAEQVEGETPKYDSIPHLIFAHLKSALFDALAERYPSSEVADKKAAVEAAQAELEAAKAAAVPEVSEDAKTPKAAGK